LSPALDHVPEVKTLISFDDTDGANGFAGVRAHDPALRDRPNGFGRLGDTRGIYTA
jgi:hypothetical protein